MGLLHRKFCVMVPLKSIVLFSLVKVCYFFRTLATVNDDFAIGGYLPDYRLRSYLDYQRNANELDDSLHWKVPITDLLLFSLQPHPRGFFSCCLQEDHFELVEEFVNSTIHASFPDLNAGIRVWITIGGGGRTQAFPEICSNIKLRQRLIGSITNLSKKHGFIGGIDLDFFQPRTVKELNDYVAFLKEAIAQWQQEGLKVSITLRPKQGRMIPTDVFQMLDRIHLMTYDMGSNGSNKYHASLDKVREAVVDLLESSGGLKNSPKKILIGIPAYARHLQNPSQVKTFGEIYDGIKTGPLETSSNVNLDALLLGMHAWEGFEWESPRRINEKVKLAMELKIGGVFFWELGQDKFNHNYPRGILQQSALSAAFDESPTRSSKSEL